MKLVTLLAQNLPAWPNDSEDGIKWITQDKNGDIFTWDSYGAPRLSKHFNYREWESDNCPWNQVEGDYDTCEDWDTAVVTEQAYYKEKERLLHKQQEWIPGANLPPVGTKCCIHLTVPSFYQETYPTVEHGMEVEILQHLDTGKGEVAVFKYLNESQGDGYYCVAQAITECFVPLKTQEQIEEEDTKEVIAQVVCDWLRQSSDINRYEKMEAIANLLYKKGLRLVK